MTSEGQIYIRGFNRSTRQQQLKKAFINFGDIKQTKMLGAYAFITFINPQDAQKAVSDMDGTDFDGQKLKVQMAGKPKRKKGPQSDDECRYCGKLGHWKNGCPQYRRDGRKRRRYSRSRSDSSSRSSSYERYSRSRRKQKKRQRQRSRKIHKRRKRQYSSDQSSYSSRSRSSSSRSSSSSVKDKQRKQKKKQKKRSSDKK